MSEKGQVTIPKGLRDQLGIQAGDVLTFREEDGRLVAEREVLDEFEAVAETLRAHDRFPGMDSQTYVEMARHGVYPDNLDEYIAGWP